jgi:hypothetical protein
LWSYRTDRGRSGNEPWLKLHLAGCWSCASLVLAIWAFDNEVPPGKGWYLSDYQLALDWCSLLERARAS